MRKGRRLGISTGVGCGRFGQGNIRWLVVWGEGNGSFCSPYVDKEIKNCTWSLVRPWPGTACLINPASLGRLHIHLLRELGSINISQDT